MKVANIQAGAFGSQCKGWILQVAVRGHCDTNCTQPCCQFPVLPDGTLNGAAKLHLRVRSGTVLCLTAGEVARMPFTKLAALWKVGSHCAVIYPPASCSCDVLAISAKQSSKRADRRWSCPFIMFCSCALFSLAVQKLARSCNSDSADFEMNESTCNLRLNFMMHDCM